jgi:hypothetical protein
VNVLQCCMERTEGIHPFGDGWFGMLRHVGRWNACVQQTTSKIRNVTYEADLYGSIAELYSIDRTVSAGRADPRLLLGIHSYHAPSKSTDARSRLENDAPVGTYTIEVLVWPTSRRALLQNLSFRMCYAVPVFLLDPSLSLTYLHCVPVR